MAHPDDRVPLADTSYFLLGNGLIRAAVQFAAGGDGTPLGLVINDAADMGPKSGALSMGSDGLAPASVRIGTAAGAMAPAMPNLGVRWEDADGVPTVVAYWGRDDLSVRERLYVPDRSARRMVREVGIRNDGPEPASVTVLAGEGPGLISRDLVIPAHGQTSVGLTYAIGSDSPSLAFGFSGVEPPDAGTAAWWTSLTVAEPDHPLLAHAFRSSRLQLPAAVSADGVVPAEIWGPAGDATDQASIAIACLQIGAWARARRVLERLFASLPLASAEGIAATHEAWRQYVLWTGDRAGLPDPAPSAGTGTSVERHLPEVRTEHEIWHGRTAELIAEARDFLIAGRVDDAGEYVDWLGRLSGARAGTWLSAYGEDGEPDRGGGGVSVRAWAEIVRLVVAGLLGVRPQDDNVHVRPRLLPGLGRISARMRIRAMVLQLEVLADPSAGEDVEAVVPYRTGHIAVTVRTRSVP